MFRLLKKVMLEFFRRAKLLWGISLIEIDKSMLHTRFEDFRTNHSFFTSRSIKLFSKNSSKFNFENTWIFENFRIFDEFVFIRIFFLQKLSANFTEKIRIRTCVNLKTTSWKSFLNKVFFSNKRNFSNFFDFSGFLFFSDILTFFTVLDFSNEWVCSTAEHFLTETFATVFFLAFFYSFI